MKLGHTNDEIKFLHSQGGVTHFGVLLDGEPTMTIICDMNDESKTIWIQNVIDGKGKHVKLATKGHFKIATKLTEDVDGMPTGAEQRVDRISVYGYILPRLHVMLGRLLRAATAA